MNYHIVRTNDKVETIINLYNLTKDELVDLNRHISNWNSLVPGTRIKLPAISEALTEELNDVEPFIEDYYPKVDLSRFESRDEVIEDNNYIYNKEEEKEELKEESEISLKEQKNSNFTNTIKLPNSYYYNPYDYYRYRRKKRS